jgi:hypothetical protein
VRALTIVHAWAYRRYVLKSLPASYTPARTPHDELKYTQKKIEANFSNFSAWHCRTKILGGLWADQPDARVAIEKDKGGESHCLDNAASSWQNMNWSGRLYGPTQEIRVDGCTIAGSLARVSLLMRVMPDELTCRAGRGRLAEGDRFNQGAARHGAELTM